MYFSSNFGFTMPRVASCRLCFAETRFRPQAKLCEIYGGNRGNAFFGFYCRFTSAPCLFLLSAILYKRTSGDAWKPQKYSFGNL